MASLNRSLAMASPPLTVPHFDGIFVSIALAASGSIPHSGRANWTQAQWEKDLRSMKDVGMSFFVLPHLVRYTEPPTSECPVGHYQAFFPVAPPMPTGCVAQVGSSAKGGTVGVALRAASNVGLNVHLGLALHPLPRKGWWSTLPEVRAFSELQIQVARRLWTVASEAEEEGAAGAAAVAGFYLEVELNNNANWFANMRLWADAFLQPISHAVKAMRGSLVTWVSPYAVGNRTRYRADEWLPPSVYGAMWEAAFLWAPAFDVVAPQDSMGAQGNSYDDAREILANVSAAASRQGRATWSNVELFEVWPQNCTWAPGAATRRATRAATRRPSRAFSGSSRTRRRCSAAAHAPRSSRGSGASTSRRTAGPAIGGRPRRAPTTRRTARTWGSR